MEVSVVDLPPPWRELWASADSPRSRLHATGGTFTVRAPNSTLAVEAVAHLRTEYRRFAGLFVANLAAARAPCALRVVPSVPLPSSVSGERRAAAMAAMRDAVRASVRAHPAARHVLVVGSVCSCQLLAEAPLTERHRRRADLCQPFREDAELAAAVRVASWEQPTAADRAADAQRTGVARAPNLVVPYPSALVGAASAAAGGGGGRRPTDLELRRPIRVLAAFGTLAADAALDDDALASRLARHCGARVRDLMRRSACAGAPCRFLVRELLLRQVGRHAGRHGGRRAAERCLRGDDDEGSGCPPALAVRLPSHACKGCSSATHREAAGSTAVMAPPERRRDGTAMAGANATAHTFGAMLGATFCLQLGGDTPTRAAVYDSIAAGCIPVLFSNASVMTDSLPPPLSFDGALHVPLALFLASPPADIVEVLAAVPDAEVRRRQRRLREWAPAFDYWGGAGERGPAARAAERLCAGPVS